MDIVNLLKAYNPTHIMTFMIEQAIKYVSNPGCFKCYSDIIKAECNLCNNKVCLRHNYLMDFCEDCNTMYCKICIKNPCEYCKICCSSVTKCNICSKKSCVNCQYDCHICCKIVCPCGKDCIMCGHIVCDNCSYKCRLCGEIYCYYCKKDLYCRDY